MAFIADKRTGWWESAGAYRQFDEATIDGTQMTAWIGEEAADDLWDQFLEQNPAGQFQQSSMWAQAKASESWSCVRALVAGEDRLIGGFQLLWRSSRFGRIGYLSKGPVLERPENPADARILEQYAAGLLKEVARRNKLRVLIIQPPDLCDELSEPLKLAGLLPGTSAGVNDATWIVDVSDGFEAVERRMDRAFRKCLDRAERGNLRVREGERSDLAGFYELMLSSCRRQNVSPNPSHLRHLLALWDAAHPKGAIRLHVVEGDGGPVAGQLDVLFGKTLTLWKKGWNGEAKKLSPNDVCMYECIRWATRAGYSRCDFASFERKMAEAMVAGQTLTEEQTQSRYVNFFRTGGRPMLLPRAQVWLPNRVLRLGYRLRYGRTSEWPGRSS
ncbi:MAG TPA: GNAT family N-acetyltransferase [Acidobacteriaceae bacterium]|nr:GNAT family N-acetyltransferase [Acidobacteriaceae bacterium]